MRNNILSMTLFKTKLFILQTLLYVLIIKYVRYVVISGVALWPFSCQRWFKINASFYIWQTDCVRWSWRENDCWSGHWGMALSHLDDRSSLESKIWTKALFLVRCSRWIVKRWARMLKFWQRVVWQLVRKASLPELLQYVGEETAPNRTLWNSQELWKGPHTYTTQ